MKWYNPQAEPFVLSGFPFYEKDKVYRRMPLEGEGILPDAVYGLADETAGGQIRFHAKLKKLCIRVSLASKPGYFAAVSKTPHMATVTQKAFDLYLSEDDKDYIFYSVAFGMDHTSQYYEHQFFEFEEEREFDLLLNFPLYGGVDKILIGVDDGAEISLPHYRFKDDKKIVIYGTSVQQGGCAGRPGMARSNLLSRLMDREVYNLGFNSSGKAEPEVARVIAEIPNIAALIVSIQGNCPNPQWLAEKLPEFVRIFRKKHPQVPIVIMPFIVSGKHFIRKDLLSFHQQCLANEKQIVQELKDAGDERIYLFEQGGNDEEWMTKEYNGHSVWHECTVDGDHYNDLGYYWLTQTMCEFLQNEVGL